MAVTSKEKAVGIIHNCAVLYNDNLSGRNVLFVTAGNNKAVCFEALFLPQNFLHLTGVRTSMNSDFFFRAALNKRLSPDSIAFDQAGATELKLEILPQLMAIHTTARMIGDYDNSRPLLVTDKFAGTVTMAMGFIYVNDLFIPNTALKIDVRDITSKATRRRVIAIFSKPRNEVLYKQLTYIAKGITFDDSVLASTLREKVDEQNLTASIPIPRKPIQERLAEAQQEAEIHNADQLNQAPGKTDPER